MKISREIKTAVLVISSILLFIWGYSFLKGRDLLNDYKTLYVEYDNVEGLATSSPVTINGLVIGKVSSIAFLNNRGRLLVALQIKSDFPISKSSVASIYEPGLIGGKQILIIPNFNDQVMAKSGDKLIGENKPGLTSLVGEKLAPIQEKLDQVLLNADHLLTGINNVLDSKGQANLQGSLAELKQTMEQFHKASSTLNSILDSNKTRIDGMVANFDKVSGDFSKISGSLEKADLGATAENLKATLAKVDAMMSDIQSGKGSVGKLLKDESLYKNLTAASKELEQLLADVKNNPKRYVNISVFGRKATPYVAPKSDSISNAKK